MVETVGLTIVDEVATFVEVAAGALIGVVTAFVEIEGAAVAPEIVGAVVWEDPEPTGAGGEGTTGP